MARNETTPAINGSILFLLYQRSSGSARSAARGSNEPNANSNAENHGLLVNPKYKAPTKRMV